MKQRILVAVLTALVFLAGLASGVSYERHRPLPPPPLPFLREFTGPRTASGHLDPPVNRLELIARVEAIRPQLEAFQKRKDEIEIQFNQALDPLLNPEQRVKHAEEIKRHLNSSRPTETRPLTDDEIINLLRDSPARTVIGDVVIPLRLDSLTRTYRLDDVQREKVRALLRIRREAFLALVDSSPPPSVVLSRLAPLVQRLAPLKPDGPPPAAPGSLPQSK